MSKAKKAQHSVTMRAAKLAAALQNIKADNGGHSMTSFDLPRFRKQTKQYTISRRWMCRNCSKIAETHLRTFFKQQCQGYTTKRSHTARTAYIPQLRRQATTPQKCAKYTKAEITKHFNAAADTLQTKLAGAPNHTGQTSTQ